MFATKHREPLIDAAWKTQRHDYLGGTVLGLGGVPLGIGGIADHVHLLVSLKPTHCPADFMRELKKTSSVWVAETLGVSSFRWQEGYGAFTVSASRKPAVQDYISKHKAHHHRQNFREELIELLQKSGIAFDERYLD